MDIPQQLKDMAEKAQSGSLAETTVRTLLSWFGSQRRRQYAVQRIRSAMDQLGIITLPDFEGEYIDGIVFFTPKSAQQESLDTQPAATTTTAPATFDLATENNVTVEQFTPAETKVTRLADPAHRISRLASANRPPTHVAPDTSVEEAITLMLRYDYSQLPVMQSDREVKGLISWKSLGSRMAVGGLRPTVRDCMDEIQELSSNASLFDAVRIIAQHDCVIVRSPNKTVCGIVTAYDISSQFQQLTEPFLLLGDIENYIRYLIGKTFSLEDLRTAKDPADENRTIGDVSDLTFGEYVRLLQSNDNWAKLDLRIDRKTFTEWLDKVREIRNDVMHFDPDPIEDDDLKLLKEFARFLQRLQQLTR